MGLALSQEKTTHTNFEFPALPAVVREVGELISAPNASLGQIAAVLKQDPVLTARVLKLVNSSYYSIPGGVTDVTRALAFLGLGTVSQLVLSVSVYSIFEKLPSDHFDFKAFWKHSLGVAIGAEYLARSLGVNKPEEIFTCGLLHDVGKLAAWIWEPAQFGKILDLAKAEKTTFAGAERTLGVTAHHGILGLEVGSRWNFTPLLRNVVRYHHEADPKILAVLSHSDRQAIEIVALANEWCSAHQIGFSGNAAVTKTVSSRHLAALGLSADKWAPLERGIEMQISKAGGLFNAY